MNKKIFNYKTENIIIILIIFFVFFVNLYLLEKNKFSSIRYTFSFSGPQLFNPLNVAKKGSLLVDSFFFFKPDTFPYEFMNYYETKKEKHEYCKDNSSYEYTYDIKIWPDKTVNYLLNKYFSEVQLNKLQDINICKQELENILKEMSILRIAEEQKKLETVLKTFDSYLTENELKNVYDAKKFLEKKTNLIFDLKIVAIHDRTTSNFFKFNFSVLLILFFIISFIKQNIFRIIIIKIKKFL